MNPQRVAALALLVASAAYTALAAGIEQPFASPFFVLGARTFPLVVGAAGIALSLVLVSTTTAGASASAPGRPLSGEWRPAIALCGLALLYALALPRIGFVLATAAFLAAAFRLLGERRVAVLAAVPIATAAVLFVLLRTVLGVYLPEPLFEAVLQGAEPAAESSASC